MPITEDELQQIQDFIKEDNLPVTIHKGWTNYSGYMRNSDALVLDIKNKNALQKIVKKIDGLNQKKSSFRRILVRPAAGGGPSHYSQSYGVHGVVDADIILRLTGEEFTSIHSVNMEENVVNLGASAQIGYINEILFKIYKRTLSTSSLNPYLTIGGVTSHGGIGTGEGEPSISGLILSLEICLPNGKLVTLDSRHEDFETIRAAHQGLYGIVTNMTIRCAPAKKLRRHEEVTNYSSLKEKIQKGLLKARPYTSIFLLPIYPFDEESKAIHSVCIYSWEPRSLDTADKDPPGFLTHVKQEIVAQLYDRLNVGGFLAAYPDWIPAWMSYVMAPLVVGSSNRESIADWFASVHHQTGYPHLIEDTGLLFEVGEDFAEVNQALDILFTTLKDYSERKKYPIITGVYIRYITGTNGGVSPTQHAAGKHVCSLDIVSDKSIPGHDEFQRDITAKLIKALNAKPHLGKFLPKDYAINCTEFNTALKTWYEQNGLDIKKSMLITNHFRKLYQLNDVPPTFKETAAVDYLNERFFPLQTMQQRPAGFEPGHQKCRL